MRVGVVSVLVCTSLGAKVLLVNNNSIRLSVVVVVDDDFCVLCVCLSRECEDDGGGVTLIDPYSRCGTACKI